VRGFGGKKWIMTGIEMIADERQSQIEKHGFTAQRDADTYTESEDQDLIFAAVGTMLADDGNFPASWIHNDWSFVQKICDKPILERLAIAGALIAAEIDRIMILQRS